MDVLTTIDDEVDRPRSPRPDPDTLRSRRTPVTAPPSTHHIHEVPRRTLAVLHGLVVHQRVEELPGGPSVTLTVTDGTAPLQLRFLGRRTIGGVALGRGMTVTGVVGTHRRDAAIWNPVYWLDATEEETW